VRQLFTFLHIHIQLTPLFSVRANLRNAKPGFNFTSNFLLRCLYLEEDGDPDDPDVGFLRGPLLLRVWFSSRVYPMYMTIALLQTYRFIFTSPSSANKVSEPTSRRRDVATMLRLDGQVTGRSIAYAATQVCESRNMFLRILPD
jgi:hypothetical protein